MDDGGWKMEDGRWRMENGKKIKRKFPNSQHLISNTYYPHLQYPVSSIPACGRQGASRNYFA
jgi:hypothetical protein